MRQRQKSYLILFTIVILSAFLFIRLDKQKQTVKEKAPAITLEDLSAPSPTRANPVVAVENKDSKIKSKAALAITAIGISEDELKRARAEARAELGSIYTAMAAYRGQWSRYTTDLSGIGYVGLSDVFTSKAGFLSAYWPSELNDVSEDGYLERPNRIDTDSLAVQYDERVQNFRLSDYQHLCQQGCTAGDTHFEVLLIKPLGDSGRADVWTINEKKQMNLVQDGTATLE